MKQVVFRVEAGPGIGLGHLRRSLSLATALREEGIQSHFLISGPPHAIAIARRGGVLAQRVPPDVHGTAQDLKVTLRAATQSNAGAVLVDFQDHCPGYLSGLVKAGLWVAVRDDLGGRIIPAHLVINGNADARGLAYRPFNGIPTRFLLGPQYLVLPREFWHPPARRIRERVQNVLVLLGGEDRLQWMPRLIRLLDELPGDFSVTAVLGPFFRHGAQVEQAAQQARQEVKWLRSPDSLYTPMSEADLAISGAGQTLYELACVGCPTVALQTAADQEGQLRALTEAGCVRRAGDAREKDLIRRVRVKASSLLSDPIARRKMARAGQRLVDGQGALRVVRLLLATMPR